MGILAPILVLLPMFFSFRYVRRGELDKAFLNVYLPALFLAPSFMGVHVKHLPPISIDEGALIPLGFAVAAKHWRNWNFTRMDVWVVLYNLGQGISEALNTTPQTALFVLYTGFNSPVLAYLMGKYLIEQKQLRVQTVKRIAQLLMIVIVPLIYEYRFGQNPYLILRGILYPEISGSWIVQMRSGHARTAGPYGHAILAGMMFAAGLVFNTWLRYAYYRKPGPDKSLFAKLERFYVPSLIILLALLMTRSRGPLLGAMVAIMIAQIARFKNVKLAGTIVAVIMLVGGIAGYQFADKYTKTSSADAADEQQGSAIYRRQLLDNYAPIIKAGGWFGWGLTEWPKVPGQESIDNQYMFVEVTQGRFGLIMFLLIGAESAFSMSKAIVRARNRDDLMFAFSMLGIVCGLFFSLATVFLGGQVAQIIFMVAGWGTALKMNQIASERTETAAANLPAYAFRRVIT